MVFGSKENEAVFTWNNVTGAVAGSLHSAGRAWTLERCGSTCYLWIEYKEVLGRIRNQEKTAPPPIVSAKVQLSRFK